MKLNKKLKDIKYKNEQIITTYDLTYDNLNFTVKQVEYHNVPNLYNLFMKEFMKPVTWQHRKNKELALLNYRFIQFLSVYLSILSEATKLDLVQIILETISEDVYLEEKLQVDFNEDNISFANIITICKKFVHKEKYNLFNNFFEGF